MEPGLMDFVGILVKFGSPPSLIIVAVWAYLERMDRISIERQARIDREVHTAKLEALARESILASQSSTAAVSTLTSLLGGPRRGGHG
jgi:hypothetical protein